MKKASLVIVIISVFLSSFVSLVDAKNTKTYEYVLPAEYVNIEISKRNNNMDEKKLNSLNQLQIV